MSRTRMILFGLSGFILALLLILISTAATPTVTADNRVNCHAASPIIIYCDDDGIMVRSITGQELLKVPSEVLETAVKPAEGSATLLGEADNLFAYLLSNGQYLVGYFNAERGEWYLVFWEGCGADTVGQGDIKVYDADLETLISDADGCGADAPPAGSDEAVCTDERVWDMSCYEYCIEERGNSEAECQSACSYDPCERASYDCDYCGDLFESLRDCPSECGGSEEVAR